MDDLIKRFSTAGTTRIFGAPPGVDAMALGRLVRERDVLYVARDESRMAALVESLAFFHPRLAVLSFPAWDCLPYDRVSPNSEVASRRIDTLARLATEPEARRKRVVVTTINAVLQRVPARRMFADAIFVAKVGAALSREALLAFLARNGYRRAETVREPGEYAVRGGIIDLFAPGSEPLRLDLFGDTLEGIRIFDAMTQRSLGHRDGLRLEPVSEVLLDEASIARFRSGYRELFGAVGEEDILYAAVSAGRRHPGCEHWLPLFHESLETLLDYLPGAAVWLDHQADEAAALRFEQIAEYYAARQDFARRKPSEIEGAPYKPLPPDRLYLTTAEWMQRLAERPLGRLSPFAATPDGGDAAIDLGGRHGADFAAARTQPRVSLFEAVREHLSAEHGRGRRVVVASYSAGARDRLTTLLHEHGVEALAAVESWPEAEKLPAATTAMAILGLEQGFVVDNLAVITEQDVLGDRLVRAARRRSRPENFLVEASALGEGDLVVHVDHGIGRYDGLATIEVAGAPHDCLRIIYQGGDKLFVPVENIDMLSRYGSEEAGAQLDKLGGVHWQSRKARIKQRITEMADALIKIAAERQLRTGEAVQPAEGLYQEFCARFPYAETEDQARSIEDAAGDLGSGRPMDRLICGDVGFGKTEVALRAAFIVAMSGMQVAVVVPTTLLCRQHLRTFTARFQGLPLKIEQLSRLVPAKRQAEIRDEVAKGQVDIVIGTSALLSKGITFKNLGLLIVDEEQHFGVAQKERLKQLKANVHVLTLTATPIPRTLQLALAGVRDMSIIATPPVDRLAVRTFVLPYDPVVLREAIMRERFRGGQTFYVCPRIEDLDSVAAQLKQIVPECRLAMAHGRLGATAIEKVMTGFLEGAYDILLSTNIVESGLDIPTVNTIIIHRADMFGLAQLYQLRGRVGRSKVRAYAYLTVPANRMLTPTAEKRLEVMQTLDSLGAGFQLASHDLDIRGAGNLLGAEQSGHIREVGIELYQHMLEEAVRVAREQGTTHAAPAEEWTPQINIGTPVLIPEAYVEDLNVRLGLYRRIATLVSEEEIDSFAAELVDRFGPLPVEVRNLLDIIAIKRLCRKAGVDKLEAGPKGAVVSFRDNRFAHPEKLIAFIAKQAGTIKVRPDQRLVYMRPWDEPATRLKGVNAILKDLVRLAA